jgi:hypothetical protein
MYISQKVKNKNNENFKNSYNKIMQGLHGKLHFLLTHLVLAQKGSWDC